MFKKIKILFYIFRLRKCWRPTLEHNLSRLGYVCGVTRFVYPTKRTESVDFSVSIYNDKKILERMWLENDKHYRKRILMELTKK